MADAKKKKQNPYVKRNIIPVRFDNEDLQVVVEKAMVYTKGEVSTFIREAALAYKPTKKVQK